MCRHAQAQTGWMKNESMISNVCIDGSNQPKVRSTELSWLVLGGSSSFFLGPLSRSLSVCLSLPTLTTLALSPAASTHTAFFSFLTSGFSVCPTSYAFSQVIDGGACDSTSAFTLNGTSLFAANNTYYGPSQVFQCATLQYNLSSWQELWRSKGLPEGGEYGSKIVTTMPTAAEIVAMAQARI